MTIRHGRHLIRSQSKDQEVVALSTGEAELYAASHGGTYAMGIQNVAKDLGIEIGIEMHVDASAAIGMMKRQGLGKLRHIEVRELWLQDAIKRKSISVHKIGTHENTADIGTKPLKREEIDKHMAALDTYWPSDTPSVYSMMCSYW